MTINSRRFESILEVDLDLADQKLREIVDTVQCTDHGKTPGLLKVSGKWQIRGCCNKIVQTAKEAVRKNLAGSGSVSI